MLCTILAVGLIALGIAMDMQTCKPEAHYPDATTAGAIVSLGTFLFAFCGHQVFPTIQHDMYEPKYFTQAVVLGFASKFKFFYLKFLIQLNSKQFATNKRQKTNELF